MTQIASTPPRTIRARIHDSAIRAGHEDLRQHAFGCHDRGVAEQPSCRRHVGADRRRHARRSIPRRAPFHRHHRRRRRRHRRSRCPAQLRRERLERGLGPARGRRRLRLRQPVAPRLYGIVAATVAGRPNPTRLACRSRPGTFPGESEAEVRPDDSLPRTGSGGAPFPHGTSISFQATETAAAIRHAAEAAARHYPLPVIFEGIPGTEPGGETNVVNEQLERRAFLDGAVHAEPWRGLAFGVFRNRNRGYNDPDLNFFGLTLPVGLPTIETVHGGTWSVRTDIGDCPDLELVLPARKEAVENDFLNEMRDAARLAIYRAMAADTEPRPAYADWKRAQDAGIDMAPPPAVLRPWRPGVADVDDWREPPKLAAAGRDALVMACDPEPPEAQALWRAADCNGIASRLFEADQRLDGYDWYDGLDRVTGIETEIAIDDALQPLEQFPMPELTGAPAAPLPQRPRAIRINLAVTLARGPGRTLDLPADLVFAGEAWSWVAEALPLVAADSDLQPHQLAELLRAGFFSPSDDADSDSWETQRDRFDQEASHIAMRLLASDDEARIASIAEAVRRELFWLVPRDRPVEISICRPEVRVTLRDAVEDTS